MAKLNIDVYIYDVAPTREGIPMEQVRISPIDAASAHPRCPQPGDVVDMLSTTLSRRKTSARERRAAARMLARTLGGKP